jgi:hypothetical protein
VGGAGLGYARKAVRADAARLRQLFHQEEEESGLEALHTAFEYNRSPRIADAIAKVTGTRPPLEKPRLVGETFPVSYRLPRAEARAEALSLADAVGRLGPGEFFAVCLLASYRGNGPYNDLMLRYENYATWFGRFLRGLHVVTMNPERKAGYEHYFKGEDAVRAAGLPFELLLEDGAVSEAIGQDRSPFVMLVDREARIRSEGALSSVDLWNAIAAVA